MTRGAPDVGDDAVAREARGEAEAVGGTPTPVAETARVRSGAGSIRAPQAAQERSPGGMGAPQDGQGRLGGGAVDMVSVGSSTTVEL